MTKYTGERVHHKMTLPERLAFYSKKDETSDCILWTGANKGKRSPYGVMWFRGQKRATHQWAYESAYGAIPPGKYVCHTCDRPACINPQHLWLGAHVENMADMVAKKRGNKCKGEAHGRAKLTDEQVRIIKSRVHSIRAAALTFGVSVTLIKLIRRGDNWKHI